jgi:hypothetical protein
MSTGIAKLRSGRLKGVVARDTGSGIIVGELRFHTPVPAQPAIPAERLPEPTFAEEIGHAGTALARWAAAGLPIAPPEARAIRYETCLRCEYWSNKARLGLGKCRHPDCGCTRLKFRWATERCPMGKWEALP